jgi:purine-nucleoside/S-methyl-5'-thioadenosine phosphorylase / adenosine deaminase
LESAQLKNSNVVHAFSTRSGTGGKLARGLNLGFTPDEPRNRIEKNRRKFVKVVGAGGFAPAEARQIHSTVVYYVRRGSDGKLEYLPSGFPREANDASPQGDALITDQPGILLSVRSADCVPILIADARGRAVAAVHAGWKGMLGGIVEKTVGEMRRNFKIRPADLRAAIGPSIAVCCYEVSEDLAEHFRGRFAAGEQFLVSPRSEDEQNASMRQPYPPPFLSRTPPGHGPDVVPGPHLNLQAAARYQLSRAGLAKSHIQDSGLCTACRTDLFYSHRKEGSYTGRMMAVIGLRPAGKKRTARVRSK